ncbi:11610_t:CDS:2, partial [Dentiscutata erythropus]
MNRLFTLTFIYLAFFFVTTFSQEEIVPTRQIYSLPLKLKRAGPDKLIADITWEGKNETETDPVILKFFCDSDTVSVEAPGEKPGTFGDRKTQYQINVHKNNTLVTCHYK